MIVIHYHFLSLICRPLADGGAQPGRISSGIWHLGGQTLYTCDNKLE